MKIIVGGGKVGTALAQFSRCWKPRCYLIEKDGSFLTILQTVWYHWNFRKWELTSDLGAAVLNCDIFISMTITMVDMVCCFWLKIGAKDYRWVRNRNIPIPASRKISWASHSCQSGLLTAPLYCQYHWLPQMPFYWAFCQWPSCDGFKIKPRSCLQYEVYPNSGRIQEMSCLCNRAWSNELTIPNGDFVLQPQDKVS